MKRISLLAILCALCWSCTNSGEQAEASTYDLILLNARIVDVKTETTSEPQLIGILEDTVRIIVPMATATALNATRTVDLEGQYVMPGLWDNHVHFRDSLERENQNLLPLFIAHGITTVRDAGGDLTPAVMRWRTEIAEGTLLGPTIFTSGPKLDGDRPSWPGSIHVTNESSAVAALDSLESLNVDYVKIYDGNLSSESYYKIIELAEQRGLNTTGHMPMNSDLFKAYENGLDGTEHLYYVLNAASSVPESLRKAGMSYRNLREMVDYYDENEAYSVYQKLAQRSFYVTPTLFIGQVLNTLPMDDHSTDSLLRYIGPGIQQTYNRRLNSALRRSEAAQKLDDDVEAIFASMVKPMHDAGILIMAGSDCGPSNSFVYPGASLIGELEALVDLGRLTPAEALRASVINGPKFFGLGNYYGTIEQGKVADIIVLVKNPLEDIRNIRSLTLVINQENIIAAQRLLK